MKPIQFRLRTLLMLATVACVCLAASLHFGALFVAIPLLLLTLTLFWGFLYHLAPDATKHFTILGIIAFCLLSLASMYLPRSREDARRNQALYNMQQLGRSHQQKVDLFPTTQIGQHGFYAEAFGTPSSFGDDR